MNDRDLYKNSDTNKYYGIRYWAGQDYYYLSIDTVNQIVPINDSRLTYIDENLHVSSLFFLSAGKNVLPDFVKYPIKKPDKTFKRITVNGTNF